MSEQQVQRPLRPGTVISYADIAATVVHDYGNSVDVMCEGQRQNWRWQLDGESCKVVSAPQGELAYRSFDDYVRDFPQGERARGWVTRNSRKGLLIVKLTDPPHEGSPHGGLAGNYMWVQLLPCLDGSLRLAAHDCDDGLMVRDFPADQEAQALQILNEMAALAPFSMWDAAKTFQFNWE